MLLEEILGLENKKEVVLVGIDEEGHLLWLARKENNDTKEETVEDNSKRLEELFWEDAGKAEGNLIHDCIAQLREGELRSHLTYISSLMEKEALPVEFFRVGEIPAYGEYSFELASEKCGTMYFEVSANEKKGDLIPMWYCSKDQYQRPATSIIDSIVKNGLAYI